MSAAFFSGVVPEMLAGGDEDERGLDILGPMSTGSSVVQSKRGSNLFVLNGLRLY